jgi:hypothetical protein
MSSSRQTRLIGEAAQATLSAATARVRHSGVARWVEERYLRGAGIAVLAADPREEIERFADLDPAAREVALGASSALETIREILGA